MKNYQLYITFERNVYLEINGQYKSNYFVFVDLIRMFDGSSYKITELYEVSKISWFDKYDVKTDIAF